MPPHPNQPCSRCSRQFGPDEVMFMAATEPPRYWNRIRTAPVCEQCLSPEEREIVIRGSAAVAATGSWPRWSCRSAGRHARRHAPCESSVAGCRSRHHHGNK
jgi:hypothetical protein